MTFFRIFSDEMILPNTGLTSRQASALSVCPEGIVYQDLPLSLQIPRFGMETELTIMPQQGNSWTAEWLGSRAGVLAGSALPGEGVSLIAGHNTLNDKEYGPFARLSELEPEDRIFVRNAEGYLLRYRVYASRLITPDDFETLRSMAEQEPGALILITCENERVEGGYRSRRVVFAKEAGKSENR